MYKKGKITMYKIVHEIYPKRANAENLFKNGVSKKLICDSLNISLSNLNQILAENNIIN